MSSHGLGKKSGIQMQMVIGDASGQWEIHAIHWQADYSLVPARP
jgi:hypothetical protein